jgi:uncharacterized protein DUF6152
MKSRFPIAFLVLICLHSTQVFPSAHHATARDFDTSKTIKLTGVVSKLEWANPHAHVYLDAQRNGDVNEHWEVELASPAGIIVSGLSKDVLGPGATLTIVGYPGKANGFSDSSGGKKLSLCATQVTLADGTTATFVVGI